MDNFPRHWKDIISIQNMQMFLGISQSMSKRFYNFKIAKCTYRGLYSYFDIHKIHADIFICNIYIEYF